MLNRRRFGEMGTVTVASEVSAEVIAQPRSLDVHKAVVTAWLKTPQELVTAVDSPMQRDDQG
jgi:hypothetical protein